jgi:DNA-binding NarL/FixJ family response regulator
MSPPPPNHNFGAMQLHVPTTDRSIMDDRVNHPAVLIADPHAATRTGLRTALDASDGPSVVAEAPDLTTALRTLRHARVDVVLADARLAGLRSDSARDGLALLSSRVPVVVMGMGDPRVYTTPLQADGAIGYWPKDGDLAQLIELLSASGPACRRETATSRA